jgi:PIN domain-containing protein
MRTNYVLIDFENVQPDSVEQLDHEHFKVLVFVGVHQERLSFEFAASLQRLGDRGKYIKISANGRDALDFHIAYYIGWHAAADPTAYFHIVSNDGGFDPLIQHLKTKKIFVRRTPAISEIPLVKISNCKSNAERIKLIVGRLQQLNGGKPRTVETLGATIRALFMKLLTDDQIYGLINELSTQGYVSISGTEVSYPISFNVGK